MNNYDILGIPQGSDITIVKKAYRKLAIEFHPDKTDGDATKTIQFLKIKQAYDELLKGTSYSQPTQTKNDFSIIVESGTLNKDGSFTFVFRLTNVKA